jgi:DNA recombination protein RmuC
VATFYITRLYVEKIRVLSRSEKEELDNQLKTLEIDVRVLGERNESFEKEIVNLNNELESKRRENIELGNQLISRQEEYKYLKEKLDTQKKEIENLQEKFSSEFKNLANEIFEEKSKKFTDQNKLNLGELLNPLKEKISDFEKKVEQTNKESIDRNASLKEQIISLKELNQKITKDAENLTRALKGETKTQGNWGEFILESILEKSGLVKGREYTVQDSFNTGTSRLQPDVILRLPDNKNIIIDSKVSLVAYERFVSSEEESERKQLLSEHVNSIRKHVKDLGSKNYQQLYELEGLDFVLMFLPIEPAFGLAIHKDDQLFIDAYEKNIVLVSPSTLIATVRTIASIWRQEYQNRNAQEIARQGGLLYDKFKAFSDDLVKVGENLKTTKTTYDAAMNKLTEGKDNLVRKTERLKELGAKVSKNIDQRLIDRASGE